MSAFIWPMVIILFSKGAAGFAMQPSGSGTVASRYFHSVSSVAEAATGLPSPMLVVAARSDIDCAGICASRLDCKQFRFAEDSLSCAIYSFNGGSSGAGGGSGVSTSWVKVFAADETNCPYLTTQGGRSFCTIQERNSASVSFDRVWTECETGFGDGGNFWIGLQRIHRLTDANPRTLRIRALMFNGSEFFIEFGGFRVGNSSTKYRMSYESHLPAQSNIASNCLAIHNGMKFSTRDQDNDGAPSGFCSPAFGWAGFWFNYCAAFNPNGIYPNTGEVVGGKYVFLHCITNNHTALPSLATMLEV